MAWIAERQDAQHLDYTCLPGRQNAPRIRIPDQDIVEIRWIKISVLALQVDPADLLRHSVKVVDALQSGFLTPDAPERRIADLLRLKFFPASAMHEDAAAQVDPPASQRSQQILP